MPTTDPRGGWPRRHNHSVQFSADIRDRVADGTITVSYRLGRTAGQGRRRYRTGAATIEVDDVELLPFSAITDEALARTRRGRHRVAAPTGGARGPDPRRHAGLPRRVPRREGRPGRPCRLTLPVDPPPPRTGDTRRHAGRRRGCPLGRVPRVRRGGRPRGHPLSGLRRAARVGGRPRRAATGRPGRPLPRARCAHVGRRRAHLRHQRIFCHEGCVDAWLAQTSHERGYVMDLATLWRLARGWYAGRLDPGYVRREPAQAAAYFRVVGVDGPFWGL